MRDPDPRHDPEYLRDHNRMFQYYLDPEPLPPNGRAHDPEYDLDDWALSKFCSKFCRDGGGDHRHPGDACSWD